MILIVDMNGKKDSLGYYETVAPLVLVAKEFDTVVVKHYSELQTKDIVNCSKIILSGTTIKDTTALREPEKFIWLKETGKPVLGICAGMEVIGLVFGLRLTSCLEIGMTQIDTVKDNPLFSASFKAYSLHNYAIEHSEDFEILAKSPQCIQAIKHKQKPIYGVLFHPEVRTEDVLKRFITLKQ
jgi:GMP synthase-like glutamine amidotransferase